MRRPAQGPPLMTGSAGAKRGVDGIHQRPRFCGSVPFRARLAQDSPENAPVRHGQRPPAHTENTPTYSSTRRYPLEPSFSGSSPGSPRHLRRRSMGVRGVRSHARTSVADVDAVTASGGFMARVRNVSTTGSQQPAAPISNRDFLEAIVRPPLAGKPKDSMVSCGSGPFSVSRMIGVGCNQNPQGSRWRATIRLRNVQNLRLTGARG